jgi:hypothetical protein
MASYEKQDRKTKDQKNQEISTERKEHRQRHHKLVSMTEAEKIKWIREGD